MTTLGREVGSAVSLDSAAYILIVEDDEEIREALGDVLEMENFRVEASANGREGLNFLLAASQLPCLIILDLMMPVMSGWDMLREIRDVPRLATIPVLISSAVESKVGLAVDGYLKKPYDLDKLINQVRHFGFAS